MPGVSDLQTAEVDPNDPAYDSDEEGSKAEVRRRHSCGLKITHNFIKIRNALHKLSVNVQTAFKTRCLAILEEYYRSEDVGEVLR